MRGPRPQKAQRARDLRTNGTRAELLVWRHIRNRQLGGFKFVRQEPVGRYFVDFVCRERQVVVEIDGGQHADNKADEKRDAELTLLGYRVIRFWNNDVLANIDGVMETLLFELRK